MRPSRRAGDYAGLVFYPASPRAVTSNAGALTSRAAGQIAMVGLLVDADDAVIADALVAAAGTRCSCTVWNRPNAWPSCARFLASRCGRRCPSPAPAMSHAPQPMPGGDLILSRTPRPQSCAARRHGVGVRLVAAGRISRCLAVGAGRANRRMLPRRLRAPERRWSIPQRRRKRAGRQGYRQDYQFRLCGAPA